MVFKGLWVFAPFNIPTDTHENDGKPFNKNLPDVDQHLPAVRLENSNKVPDNVQQQLF